jgi:hypothetical protein
LPASRSSRATSPRKCDAIFRLRPPLIVDSTSSPKGPLRSLVAAIVALSVAALHFCCSFAAHRCTSRLCTALCPARHDSPPPTSRRLGTHDMQEPPEVTLHFAALGRHCCLLPLVCARHEAREQLQILATTRASKQRAGCEESCVVWQQPRRSHRDISARSSPVAPTSNHHCNTQRPARRPSTTASASVQPACLHVPDAGRPAGQKHVQRDRHLKQEAER